jgi:hypothetical protein
MTQPHLADGLDRVSRRLGGVTRVWRLMALAEIFSERHRGHCR